MKRNNRLGSHDDYPMPPRYKGGSNNFSLIRNTDGHVPLTDADTDGDMPIQLFESRNCHYPTAEDYEFPLNPRDASFEGDTY